MANRPVKKVIQLGKGYVAHHRAGSVYIYRPDAAKKVLELQHGMLIAQLAEGGFGVGRGIWFKSRWGDYHDRDIPYFIREFKRTYLKRLQYDS